MEGSLHKLFAPIVLVALILVLSTTTVSSEEMPKMYVMEEVTMVEPNTNMVHNNGNIHKPKMMIMQFVDQQNNKEAYSMAATTTSTTSSSTESGLRCADEGEYCNTLFGNSCCPGIDCVQGPFVGGRCHKW
ncbi:uncharacterized protein [Spinacia oleracea]|uniref:Granulins domain-containing protein n=1 Tax=Spinacia oleracea TaxID=3562 RepID=A0ABM3R2T8_SPIOL|nr:uncharacterized protein LOC130464416 [Spinacia oleracea]